MTAAQFAELHPDIFKKVTDNAKAEGEKSDGCHTEIDKILRKDIGRIFRPDKPGFHHPEACLHKKYEKSCYQYPDRVQAKLQIDNTHDCKPPLHYYTEISIFYAKN